MDDYNDIGHPCLEWSDGHHIWLFSTIQFDIHLKTTTRVLYMLCTFKYIFTLSYVLLLTYYNQMCTFLDINKLFSYAFFNKPSFKDKHNFLSSPSKVGEHYNQEKLIQLFCPITYMGSEDQKFKKLDGWNGLTYETF